MISADTMRIAFFFAKDHKAFMTGYCLLSIAVVTLYLETLSKIVATWSTYQGSHGPVILAIAISMIWMKRGALRGMVPSPNVLWGGGLTLAGCFLLVCGRFGSILLLQYLSLIVTLLGLVLLLWGGSYFKALWYPMAYIVFMFPIFSEVLDVFSLQLQTVAAWVASTILSGAGIAVYRHGHVLDLPMISLDVARECNGINHIMALVSLAIPLAFWTPCSLIKKLIVIGAAFPIGVIANGLRVSVIGAYAYYQPGGPVHGPYDLFYVSFIFFFGMICLMGLSSSMRVKAVPTYSEQKPSSLLMSVTNSSARRRGWVVFTAVAIMFFTGGYLALFEPEPVQLAEPIGQFPYRIGNWAGRDVDFKESVFGEFQADIELKRIYSDESGNEVGLYVGYFPSQKQDKEIVHYRFDPLQRDAVAVQINTRGGDVDVKMTQSYGVGGYGSVYFWYSINGKIVIGRYAAKVATILDSIVHRRANAAIVVLAVKKHSQGWSDSEIVEEFFPILQAYLRIRDAA